MLRVALTGGIATGKTHCVRAFSALGVPVIDADVLAREAVAPGSPGLKAIEARFGLSVFTAGGALDRAALGRIVFADPRARADLEAIIHPDVYRRIREWLANLPMGTRLAMADIPLLFETGQQHDFDRVVVCASDPEAQVQRIMARDRLDEAAARARIAAQWPISEKAARGDYVIWTDRGYAETDAQVTSTYQMLIAEV